MQAGAATVIDYQAARRKLFRSFQEKAPQDDDELHFWCKEYLGYDIPNRPSGICPDHDAPFKFISKQFFEQSQNVFAFANRSGGKTIMVAMLNVVDAFFKPGIEILCAGAVQDQADKGYQYVSDFLVKEELLENELRQLKRGETILGNGSKIKLTTATYSGLNGPHPCKFRLDEIELLPPWIINEGLSMSQSQNGWRGQNTFMSTRKVPKGTVQNLLDEADQKGIDVVRWCIWETLEKCTRQCKDDPKYGNCRAYSKKNKEGEDEILCGGRAHDVPEGGWYPIDDFIQKAAVLDQETFEAQWLCIRPASGLLVYGRFFRDDIPFIVRTQEGEKLIERAKAERNWARVIGIDFGSRFGVGYFMQDPLDRVWYQYHELYWPENMDMSLKGRAEKIRSADPLGWSNRTVIFADPAGRQAITDLHQYGVEAVPANNDVWAGIQHMKMLFSERTPAGLPLCRIFGECSQARNEIGGYRYVQEKDGTVNMQKIHKDQDEMADVIRYALYSYATTGTHKYTQKKLRGVW